MKTFSFVISLLPCLILSAQAQEAMPKSIVAPDATVVQLGTGMKFTEGPVWIQEKKMVVLSDTPNSSLMQWTEKDGLKLFRKVEQTNGNLLDLQDRLLSCQHAGRNVIRAFDVLENTIGNLPAFEIPIRCDGMCIDTKGNIYTTSTGGVHVFDKDGKKLGVIATPEHPANVCFGGKDFDTLFITARKSLYSVKTLATGALPPKK